MRKESFGLCGQVAVAAILRGSGKGVTADQVVEDYLDAVQKGLIYDKSPADPNYTGAGQLRDLIDKVYSDYLVRDKAGIYTSSFGLTSANKNWGSVLRDYLGRGYVILASVQMLSGAEAAEGGRVGASEKGLQLRNNALSEGQPTYDPSLPKPCDKGTGVICHWVAITGISNQWNMTPTRKHEFSPWNWVRVYNPYDNQPEYYWFGDFKPAWDVGGYAMIPVKKR